MKIKTLTATVFSLIALLLIGMTYAQDGIGHGHSSDADPFGVTGGEGETETVEEIGGFFGFGSNIEYKNYQRQADDERAISEKKIQELQSKVGELRRLGRNEEADRLETEIKAVKKAQAKQKDEMFFKAQNDFEQKVQDYNLEINRLHEEGKHDAAEMLTAELMYLKAQKHQEKIVDLENVIHDLQNKIKLLHSRGSHEDAAKLERKLIDLQNELDMQHKKMNSLDINRDFGGGPDAEVADLERKIHHLVTAADNLFQIGHNEQAEEIMTQAQELEHQLQMMMEERNSQQFQLQLQQEQQQRAGDEGLRRHVEELTGMVRDLRREVAELREIVGQLQHHIELSARGEWENQERQPELIKDR